jgi:Domain of Unknown Function (DUF1080)
LFIMKKYISVAAIFSIFYFSSVHAQTPDTKATEPSIEGRWDLEITADGKTFPSWLEVSHSGNSTLVGRFVAAGGSARPISKIIFKDGKMNFTIPPQWERGTNDLSFEATLQGDALVGTVITADGKTNNWKGSRAPLLKRSANPVWGKSIQLLKSNSLDGWHAVGNTNQWVVEGGVLKSPKSGANLVTDQKYTDFKLHIEFRCPKGSNSGVYLRGRYEVQIEDDLGKEPDSHLLGGIYGFLTPNEMAARSADEWQTYDITLVGRLVTVVANGKEIITRQAIPGITGGALDSKEEEPGPIYLQGDHGPIEYRNIIITPVK